jgi:choline dehydrogenase-like flavoprotein
MYSLNWHRIRHFLVLANIAQALVSLEYDYLIVGGGPCGLTLANRLTEIADITVAVIEAGASVIDNELVYNVNDFTLAFGTSIDWQYESTNQTYAAGQKIAYHSGKALGGTSTINGTSIRDLVDAADETSRNDICPS